MDDDGKFTIAWLENAGAEDVRDALVDLTADQLAVLCDAQGWKARLLSLLHLTSYAIFRNQAPSHA
jgi:hypothetical protein